MSKTVTREQSHAAAYSLRDAATYFAMAWARGESEEVIPCWAPHAMAQLERGVEALGYRLEPIKQQEAAA